MLLDSRASVRLISTNDAGCHIWKQAMQVALINSTSSAHQRDQLTILCSINKSSCSPIIPICSLHRTEVNTSWPVNIIHVCSMSMSNILNHVRRKDSENFILLKYLLQYSGILVTSPSRVKCYACLNCTVYHKFISHGTNSRFSCNIVRVPSSPNASFRYLLGSKFLRQTYALVIHFNVGD